MTEPMNFSGNGPISSASLRTAATLPCWTSTGFRPLVATTSRVRWRQPSKMLSNVSGAGAAEPTSMNDDPT